MEEKVLGFGYIRVDADGKAVSNRVWSRRKDAERPTYSPGKWERVVKVKFVEADEGSKEQK